MLQEVEESLVRAGLCVAGGGGGEWRRTTAQPAGPVVFDRVNHCDEFLLQYYINKMGCGNTVDKHNS